MLIEFNLTNFRSINTKQTFSMVAANRVKQHPNHVIALQKNNKKLPNLLTTTVIYGANAAGKSNLIKAFAFMASFVSLSQQSMQKGESIDKRAASFSPFLFNASSCTRVSEFEAIFIQEGVRYQYGFAANRELVTHEWLFAYPEGRPQQWFERIYHTEKKEYEWHFGGKFKGSQDAMRKKIWQEATRDNGLFLSAAVQNGNMQLIPVFEWFKKIMFVGPFYTGYSQFSAEQYKNNRHKQEILSLVKAADPSIVEILIEEREMPIAREEIRQQAPFLKEEFIPSVYKRLNIEFVHTNGVKLDYSSESAGTQKIFDFAGPLSDILKQGNIAVIDELDSHLHPLLVRELIKIFHNPEINKNHAQMIFTTHDTSVLDRDIFRRDQIWLVEKDPENASQFYALSDFKIREDEALAKGYLKGKYGAVPYIMGDLI